MAKRWQTPDFVWIWFEVMTKKTLTAGLIVIFSLLVLLLLFERQLAAENSQYLEWTNRLVHGRNNLRLGMKETEISPLLPGPPDEVIVFSENTRLIEKKWIPERHYGRIYVTLGIKPCDAALGRGLRLRLDENGTVVEISDAR